VYKKEDLESGTGIIINSAYGTEYTVRETSKLAIRKSDNCGVNMIIRQVGIENVRQYILGLGGKVYYGKTHRSCPYDMALVAQDLYKHYINNEAVYGELINNLENTDWTDRIDAKLPQDIKVAHKIGNQTKTANDVGIVFGKHPYILSVMSENVDFGTACNNIANLSKVIFDFEEAYASQTPVMAE
jgi:beta-lactamase class A